MVWNYQEKKTQLMVFNNGETTRDLPRFQLDGITLKYSQSVKVLGVFFTPKLSWKTHIEYLINKGRMQLNLLKIISFQPWSQNVHNLLHLAVSLIRSTLSYGQEVYFSANKTLLNRLQSLDSRAIKLALGVPIHTNSSKSYKEVDLLSLSKHRKLASSKYVIRSLSVENSVSPEIFLDAEKDYPKRARQIPYLQPLRNYTDEIFQKCSIDICSICILPRTPILPSWEHNLGNFEIRHGDLQKNENSNLLLNLIQEKMHSKYFGHLKVYTDGSVLESGDCGCGIYIPSLNFKRSYFMGKYYSIFSAELLAIHLALLYV